MLRCQPEAGQERGRRRAPAGCRRKAPHPSLCDVLSPGLFSKPPCPQKADSLGQAGQARVPEPHPSHGAGEVTSREDGTQGCRCRELNLGAGRSAAPRALTGPSRSVRKPTSDKQEGLSHSGAVCPWEAPKATASTGRLDYVLKIKGWGRHTTCRGRTMLRKEEDRGIAGALA